MKLTNKEYKLFIGRKVNVLYKGKHTTGTLTHTTTHSVRIDESNGTKTFQGTWFPNDRIEVWLIQ